MGLSLFRFIDWIPTETKNLISIINDYFMWLRLKMRRILVFFGKVV